MAIEIYHLPPGTGEFRKRLMRSAMEDSDGLDYSEIYYLAPTNQILRGFRDAFHDEAGDCYVPPHALTLRQLSRRLYNSYGEKMVIPGALSPVIISGITGCSMGLAIIVAELIRELKQHYPSTPPDAVKKILSEVFAEYKMPHEAAKRALEAMDMFALYQEALRENNALDEDEALPLAAGMAERRLSIRTLILDGFYEVTPAEELMIKTLMRKAGRAIITIPVSGINDDLSYCYSNSLKDFFKVEPVFVPPQGHAPPEMVFHPAPSMEEEIEGIAKQIKAEFLSGRQRDLDNTLLVFPGLDPYRATVERVFARYGIPLNISTQRTLRTARPYPDLMGLLEAVRDDYPRAAFTRFLTSPAFRDIPDKIKEAVPRISLSSGIIKGRDAWLDEFGREGAYEEGVMLFKRVESIKLPLNKATYSGYVEALLNMLRGLGFRPDEGGLAEFEGLLGTLGVLDGMVSRGLDLAGFIEALERVLERPMEGEETPGVRVAELKDVRGLEPAMLYMAGIKDGDIPSRPEMDFLLPETVRRRLGLNDLKKHMSLQEFIFRRLTSASRGLYISYPSMEGDKFYLPSIFLSGAREERKIPTGIFSLEEDMLRQRREPLSRHLREINRIRLSGKDKAIRVTDIDAYRACPRRFFIEKALRLTPTEVMDYELEPRTLGTIVHEVMERLIGEEIPASLDAFSRRASEALEEVLEKSAVDLYFRRLIRETFLEIVPEIYENEEMLKEEGYLPSKTEYDLRCEPLKGVKLKGKVDRIDSKPDGGVEIIDYKTGSVGMRSSTTLRKGANLQLFLYAAMLKTLGMRPERAGIYSLKDVGLKWFPTKRDRKKGLGIEDFIESSLKYLDVTVKEMQRGDFTAMPLEEQACRNCPERPYCPYIQRGGGRTAPAPDKAVKDSADGRAREDLSEEAGAGGGQRPPRTDKGG